MIMRVFVGGCMGASAILVNHNGMKKLNPEHVAELLKETQAEWVSCPIHNLLRCGRLP